MNFKRLKVWTLILLISFTLLAFGYLWAERWGLVLMFFLALGLNSLLFFLGDRRILDKIKAQPLLGQDPWNLSQMLQEMHRNYKPNEDLPQVYLLDSARPQVFCIVQSWYKISFCFTTGLLNKLSSQELKATCALLTTHSQRLQSFRFLIFAILINCFLGLIEGLQKISPFQFTGLQNQIYSFFLKIMNPRLDIYHSDQQATQLFTDRFTLGNVLNKLNNYSNLAPIDLKTSSHYIFVTHTEMRPVIAQRIKKLVGYFPL